MPTTTDRCRHCGHAQGQHRLCLDLPSILPEIEHLGVLYWTCRQGVCECIFGEPTCEQVIAALFAVVVDV